MILIGAAMSLFRGARCPYRRGVSKVSIFFFLRVLVDVSMFRMCRRNDQSGLQLGEVCKNVTRPEDPFLCEHCRFTVGPNNTGVMRSGS